MQIAGLDIGGANIKGAHTCGIALSRPFPLWQSPERLHGELAEILRWLPAAERIAVTMTGELADCFATKREGVERILRAVQQVAADASVHVWSTHGRFLTPMEAVADPFRVAAANWHAVASWWGKSRRVSSGILIDIGSTTTDIIPIVDQKPATHGLTDASRLLAGELVYSGGLRTPLCAISRSVPFRGGRVSLAAELFSTSLDLGLMLGEIPDDEGCFETANRQPATRDHAWDRIARQICCDRTECSRDEALEIARFIRDEQLKGILESYLRVRSRFPENAAPEILLSGSGRFLAAALLKQMEGTSCGPVTDLGESLSPDLASAACAYAVVQLARDEDLN